MENQSPINYSVESLVELFTKHADDADNQLAEQIKTYHQINSDPELPDHMKNPFNLPRALAALASAIRDLQAKS